MMKPLLRKSILAGVILLIFIGGSCVYYADRILDEVIRPWAEEQASQSLNGEVRIGALSLQTKRLVIETLSVQTPTGLSLSVPRIEVGFSFASLLQRRLESVHIDSPQLNLLIAQETGEAEVSQPFPSPPTLTIDLLTLDKGEALVQFGEQRVVSHNIAVRSALGEKMPFTVSALLGEGAGNPLMVRGQARWGQSLALSFQEVLWQKRPMLDAPLDLELLGGGETRGGGTLRFESLDEQKIGQLLTAFGLADLLPKDLAFKLQSPAVSLALMKDGLSVRLAVQSGQVRQSGTMVTFTDGLVELNGQSEMWQGHGSLRGPAETTLSFEAAYQEDQLSGVAALEIPEPDRLLQEFLGVDNAGLRGALLVDANFFWKADSLKVTSQLRSRAAKTPGGSYRLNLEPINGKFDWQQRADKDQFTLNLRLGKKDLLSASGDFSRMKFALSSLNKEQLSAILNPSLLPAALDIVEGLTVTGQVSQDRNSEWSGDAVMAAGEIIFSGVGAKKLLLQGRLRFAQGDLFFEKGKLSAEFAKGDELSGRLSSSFAAQLVGQKYALTLKKVSFDRVEYLAADGLSGLGSGGMELQGLVSGQLDQAALELDLTGSVKAGEVLTGPFYADLSPLQGQFKMVGELNTERLELKAKAFTMDIPELATLKGIGLFSPANVALTGGLQFLELTASYGKLLGPMLAESYTFLQGLVLKGVFAVDYQMQWAPSGARIAGEIRPDGLNVSWPTWALEIEDSTGRIPFVMASGAALEEVPASAEHYGDLSFAAFSAGHAHLEKGSLKLAAAQNHFSFRSPLVFDLADGRVAISDLSFGFDQAGPRGSVRIAVKNIDLEMLTQELALPVMQGKITADLGVISYVDQQLSSEGVAQIDVFDGLLLMRNMRYLDPFSPYPVFAADIDFSGLDLNQATRTFEFGEMNGVVDGYVHGLRLFGTTPSSFEALLETRPTGKRNISVKALNNISILSQGGISAVLSKGIYSFIDFYRYQKIGLYCALENDTFVLQGRALSNSDQYLVYGGLLPPRINIKSIASRISFKEMMRRIGRIERAGH